MPGVILFGVDVESPGEACVGYARFGQELYHQLDVPVTFFLTGRVIEFSPDIWAELEKDDLIHLEAHTYDHLLLKTICLKVPPGKEIHGSRDYYLHRGGTLEEIEADLDKCVRVFKDAVGRAPIGLTGPWGYYRGLQDRPDILDILERMGFKFLRTFARDERDGQPVPFIWQPFFYTAQGHPDMLECMIHDYQDDFYWELFTSPKPGDSYVTHLKAVTDHIIRYDLVWSAASHDHGCATKEGFARKAGWIREWFQYAKDRGVRFMSYEDFYNESVGCVKRRRLCDGADAPST